MLTNKRLIQSVSIRNRPGYDMTADPLVALRWVLNYCDGEHGLLDIAELSDVPMPALASAAQRAHQAGLLTIV